MKCRDIIYLILLSVFMLVSCVAEDLNKDAVTQKPQIEEGEFYINVSVSSFDNYSTKGLSPLSTRVSYDNGFDWESEIRDGNVYIFEERQIQTNPIKLDTVCVSSGFFDAQQILSTENGNYLSTELIKIYNIPLSSFPMDLSKKYMALVVVNADNSFIAPAIGDSFSIWSRTPQSSQMVTERENDTYKIAANGNKDYKKSYITMINATGVNNYTSGIFTPEILVEINKSDITKQPVETGVEILSPVIYLQRNVVKVVVQPKGLTGDLKMVRVGEWNVQVNINNCGLEVVNKTTYPVSITDGFSYNDNWKIPRFTSGAMANGFTRTYWAKDPNYSDVTLTTSDFDKTITNYDARQPMYCLENTFNTECQLQGQTTRALVICKWAYDAKDTGGNKISTFPEDCIFLYDEKNNRSGFYRVGYNDEIWCRYHIEEAIKERINDVLVDSAGEITIEWKDIFTGGYYKFEDLLTIYNNGEKITGESLNQIALVLDINDIKKDDIAYYHNCIVYYTVRIPHFDDKDVPWDPDTEYKVDENGRRLANYSEEKHLGRYGVIRNNYYEISVTKIGKLGSPCSPPITDDDTDDMPGELDLLCEIRVLSWLKNDISVTF